MFKFCFICVCSLLITGVSYAQETPKAEFEDNPLPIIEENESFVDKNEQLGNITLPQAPTCDNEIFLNKAKERIKEYSLANTSNTVISKRKNALVLAHVKDFEEVSVKKFSPKEDFNTANALITIKINKYVQEKEFVLCRQKGVREHPIYLVAYPYLDNYMVHIINLDIYSEDYEKVSFTYP